MGTIQWMPSQYWDLYQRAYGGVVKENMFGQEPSCVIIPTKSFLLQCAAVRGKKKV